jgi:Protein of unknown function (DUF3300)
MEYTMNPPFLNSRVASAAFVLLAWCALCSAQQPPDNVAGDWTITSQDVANGGMQTKVVQIVQNGSELSGYFQGPNQAGPITGHVDIHHIEFSTVTRNVLNFHGVINGNTMSGMYGIHGKHAEWSAVREGVPQTVTIYTTPAPAPAPAPSDQLESLVAPIALYPDALVAQVLSAAGFPDQVAIADYWLKQNTSLTGAALLQAVDQQSWDASVKALTQFPTVLDTLANNLAWTSSLGQAFEQQQAEVMAAVQTMRAKAQSAGTLASNSQISVVQQSPQTIVIRPANPQVVYVPQYNPAVVYGAPLVVPLYTPPVGLAASITFGTGVAIGAVVGGGVGFGGVIAGGGGGFAWGFHAWNCNWGGGGGGATIIYNHNTYIHNNTWNNNHYNGYHPWGPGPHGDGPYGPHPYGPNGGHPPGYVPTRDQPNGGRNGDRGLIGGNGGVQHPPGYVPTRDQPNGGRNGDHGLIGGNGGTQHIADQSTANNRDRASNGDQQRSHMSGNGADRRAESSRGHASMARPHPQPHRAAPQHHAAPHPAAGHRR